MAQYRSIALLLVLGCGKSDKKQEPPPQPVVVDAGTDQACVEKLRSLGVWLESLQLEVASHEIDFGSKLLAIDGAPSPVEQQVDNVTIKPKTIQIWDASEANRVGNEVDAAGLVTRLAQTLNNTEKADAPNDLLRIDVDQDATWEPVARVADAAMEAGYTRVVFAFTATSKLVGPAGVEPRTTTREAVDAASEKLEELQVKCEPWRSAVLTHKYGPTKADNAISVAKETVAALRKCNCAADPDEVVAAMWIRDRWHQAVPRVGIELTLAKDAKPIALPKTTPWAEAAAKIVDARGRTVKLAATL